MSRCLARLSLILPDDDYPEIEATCEKREGHRDYHGTLSGYCWESFKSDRPKTDALVHIATDGTVTFPDDVEVIGDEVCGYRLTSPHLPGSVQVETDAMVTMPSGVAVNLFDAVTEFLASR